MTEQHTSPTRQRLQLTLFSAVVFLYWAALYLYVPTLPVYVQTKTTDLQIIGVVVSMYGLWQALLRLPLGIVSDWLGRRKPFILLGLFLVGLGAWVMGSAEGVTGVLVGRSITGVAASTWVLMVVVFSGLFPPKEAVRAASILTLFGSLARFIAVSLTGVLNDLGGYPLSYFLAAGLALAALGIYFFSHETPRPRKPPSLGVTGRLVTRRDVLVPALISTVFQYVSYASSFGFLPILAKELGANNLQLSLMVSLTVGFFALGNLSATWASRRFASQKLVLLGLVMSSLGLAAAALAPSLALIYIAQFLIGLSGGLSYPVLMGMSIEHVDDAQRSTAMGLHQAVYAIGMFAGPWLSGMIADAMGIQPMFLVTAAATFLLGWFGLEQLKAKTRIPRMDEAG
jgi:MFS family permease